MFNTLVTFRWGVVAAAAAAAASAVLLGGTPGAEAAPPTVAAKVDAGVVDVNTNLAYANAAAAGTGIVLSASGEVLTNNHVIRGATTIRVTDVASGHSYPASVVGYEVSADVALLRLRSAAGLRTASIGDSSTVELGDRVTAVGNAGGAGGTPSATNGKVTALHQSITVSDGHGGVERLTGLIKTSAPLQPGESGGPLLSGPGLVIGIDTAASSEFEFASGGSEGFAIPINRATAITKQIEAGRPSATVHIGPTAFLGVEVRQSGYYRGSRFTASALVEGVVSGSPAEKAGLVPGDVITSFNGHTVSSPTTLTNLLLRVSPGAKAQLRWLDQLGNAHSAAVRPAVGPPQ